MQMPLPPLLHNNGNKAKSRDLPGIGIPNISLELSAPRNEVPSPGTELYLLVRYGLVIY